MVFRVPTQFDTFPSPSLSGQRRVRPWRGRFVVTGLRNSNRNLTELIFVSAVETDGDKVDLWPQEFVIHRLYSRPLLRQVMQYVQENGRPTCNFLPERLDPETTELNRANFRALSRQLHENEEVAVVTFGPQSQLSATGGGIIIYPAINSGAYLIGAVFEDMAFPAWITHPGHPPSLTISPSVPYSPHAMGPPSSSYGAHVSHIRHPHSGSPHHSHPNSPVDQPGSSYRSLVPRTPIPHGSTYPNLPSGAPGSSPTNTAPGTYAAFHPQNPPFP